MRSALKVTSWIAVIIGLMAIVGGISELTIAPENAYYSLLGGIMFFSQGLLTLIYVSSKEK